MAVFVGGFTLEAAEAVVARLAERDARGGGPDDESFPDGTVVLDAVTALLDAGLVRRLERGEEPRFGMLETVREFALDRLLASSEGTTVRDAHAAFFLALAEEAEPYLLTPDQRRWFGRLEAELANLHAAFDWLHARGEATRALRLAAALGLMWTWPPYLRDGRVRLAAALAMPAASEDLRLRCKVLGAAGNVASWQGDMEAAAEYFAAALEPARALGDDGAVAGALRSLANVAIERGDLDHAERLLDECRPLFERLADGHGLGFALATLGRVASARGDHRRALQLHRDAYAVWAAVPGEAYTPGALTDIGWEYLQLGDPEAARAPYAEVLAYWQKEGDERALADTILGAAAIVASRKEQARAARLIAAASRVRQEIGVPLASIRQAQLDRLLAGLRASLGDLEFDRAWRCGWETPTPDAEAEAAAVVEGEAGGTPAGPDGQPVSTHLARLSPREVEVLRLLVEGQTDKEIASRLAIRRGTVSNHVSAILDKLGVPSRAAAAAAAVRDGLI